MYLYVPLEEHLHSNEIGDYLSFGLILKDENGRELVKISDISTDEAFITEMCQLFNIHQLSPIHLLDVIEDFLN